MPDKFFKINFYEDGLLIVQLVKLTIFKIFIELICSSYSSVKFEFESWEETNSP